MNDLNDLELIKKLDPKDVLGSTEKLYDQCKQVLEDLEKMTFNPYEDVKNIVICGMGGSAYGGHVALSLFKDQLNVPFAVLNDYHLPAFVDSTTLVILTSYSGSTEETLSCSKEALEKGAKIFVLTSGGDLEQFSKQNNLQSYIFNPVNNPSGQPRLGTGYIVFGTIVILDKLGFVKNDKNDIESSVESLKINADMIKRKAREDAQKIQDKIPVLFAGDFLEGNIHIIRNQINETAKSFSAFSPIPELNHHLMEGLKNPSDRKLICLLFNSSLYEDRIKKRFELTKEVVEKNGIEVLELAGQENSKLGQVLSILSYGGFLSFYLAILYGQDPSLIPWVDYFKEQLKK